MNSRSTRLSRLLQEHEDWLMGRVLTYAHDKGYTEYTSTLQEAWRLSIAGLSESLVSALEAYQEIPELTPHEDYAEDPCAEFGIVEARRHRARGVGVTMFLSMFKYYRQAYLEMIEEACQDPDDRTWYRAFLERVFDRIELGFVAEWNTLSAAGRLDELNEANRALAHEKNKYLTIFESLASPVILTDTHGKIRNLNHAAARLFQDSCLPGAMYYRENPEKSTIPWLELEVAIFRDCADESLTFEKVFPRENEDRVFEVKLARMLDVSEKFVGITVILNEITLRKKAQAEREAVIKQLEEALEKIKTMEGLIPICASCKKVRQDTGYWEQIESYVSQHADVQFSHGLCPDCVERLYPGITLKGAQTE